MVREKRIFPIQGTEITPSESLKWHYVQIDQRNRLEHLKTFVFFDIDMVTTYLYNDLRLFSLRAAISLQYASQEPVPRLDEASGPY